MIIPKNPLLNMAARLKFGMMPIVLLFSVVIFLVTTYLNEVEAHPTIKLGHPYWQNTSLGYRETGRAEGERGLSFVEQIITSESIFEGDMVHFGHRLDITNKFLVVSTYYWGGFVYEKEGSSWVFNTRLYHILPETWTDPSTNNFVIVVFVFDYIADASYRLLIFERATDTWNLAQVYWSTTDQVCTNRDCAYLVTGESLATSVIFIGEYGTSTIRIHRKNGNIWELSQLISEPEKVALCAVSGNYLVSMKSNAVVNGNSNAGIGVVFKLNGNEYERLYDIQSPAVSQNEVFGQSVSLNDRWLAVGASQKVYIFQRNGDNFSLFQQLSSPTGCKSYCDYANRIRLSGDILAVSNQLESVGGLSNVGVLHVYEFSSGSWAKTNTIQPSVPEEAEQFSHGLGFAWDVIAVGAQGKNGVDGVDHRGAVFLESFVRTPVPTPTPTPTATPTPSFSLSPSPSPSPSLPPIPGPVTETPTWSRAPVTATPTLSQAPVTQTPTWSRAPVTQSPTTNPGPVTEAPSPIVTLNPDVSHTPTESQKSDPDSKSFPIGAVVGGVVGGLAVIAIVVAGVMIWMKKSHASNDNTSAGPTMEQDAADGSTTGLNNVNAVDEESQPSAFEVLLQPRDDPVLLPAGYDLAFADDTLPEPNMDVSLPYMGNAGSGR